MRFSLAPERVCFSSGSCAPLRGQNLSPLKGLIVLGDQPTAVGRG